jgi:hypothetical protein
MVWNPQASAPITSGTHTDGKSSLEAPGSKAVPQLEVFCVLFYDCCFEGDIRIHGMNGKRTHRQSNTREIKQYKHQEIVIFIYLFVHIFDYV